jgi:hypothetical protein
MNNVENTIPADELADAVETPKVTPAEVDETATVANDATA